MTETIKVSMAEAEAMLDELIDAAQRGANVVILRDGREAVQVVAYPVEGFGINAHPTVWSHDVQFDRMIAAVALQERVVVVRSDTAFETGSARVW